MTYDVTQALPLHGKVPLPSQASDGVPLQSDGAPLNKELHRACAEFEGMFIANLMKSKPLLAASEDSPLMSANARQYQDMLFDELAADMGTEGYLGIAGQLYREMQGA